MSFLNAALALGTLAFVIPLVIHLLFRNRFETVDWGAMYLLGEAVDSNRRQFQLNDLLLLLVRCLIPILLAICLARPVLHHLGALPGDAPQTFVVVIDDSRSMSVVEPNEVSRMEKAKQQLSQFLETLSRRDDIMLVLGSHLDDVAPKMGVHEAITKIRSLNAESGPIDVGRLVGAGSEVATQASHPHCQVIVISDFQSNMVDDAAVASVDSTAASLRGKTMPPMYSFWNIAEHTEKLKNLSVDSIKIDAPAVVAGRRTPFDTIIRNASDVPVRNLRVVWSVDGAPAQLRTINLEPRSSSSDRVFLKFDQPGPHQVAVSIEHSDALVDDNTRELTADVLRQVKVLLVNGDPSTRPLKGETDFLAIALSPFSFGSDDRPDPIRTEVVSFQQFGQQIREDDSKLSEQNVIVLANVRQIDKPLRARLSVFVANGGSLVIFDGDQVDPSSFNEDWGDGDDVMKLPAALGEVVGRVGSRDQPTYRVGDVDSQFTPWDVFADDKQQLIRSVGISAYRKLSRNNARTGQDAGARTVLSIAGGDPLVVIGTFGDGQIAQLAIPCDADWTTLPLRPVFVPMMHQLVMELAGNTRRSGDPAGQVSAAESELRDVNAERLQSLAASLGGNVYASLQAIQNADQTHRFGREVWRWLLIALLIALVAEVLVQQRRSHAPAFATSKPFASSTSRAGAT